MYSCFHFQVHSSNTLLISLCGYKSLLPSIVNQIVYVPVITIKHAHPRLLIIMVHLMSKMTLTCIEYVCVLQVLLSDSIKTHVWHAMCYPQVRFHVLDTKHISCPACYKQAHKSDFMCCTWVRLLCAACESVFSCAAHKLRNCQVRTKAYNKMSWSCKQNMIKCMDTQKIAFCQTNTYFFFNSSWMTLYCTTKHDNGTKHVRIIFRAL